VLAAASAGFVLNGQSANGPGPDPAIRAAGPGAGAMAAVECHPAEHIRKRREREAASSLSLSCEGVDWGGLLRTSLLFNGVQHGFRIAREQGTRDGLRGPFFRDWGQAVSRMHGWSDGDPFFVNYIGHSMMGAVTGHIWANHDRRFSSTTFGRDPDYWKGRLRAAAFMWAYSKQFEIGPLSQASIGNIQRNYPSRGYVDHVLTPALGLLWMIGEDALDRYIILPFENRVENAVARMVVRGFLNPTRSFAHWMSFRPFQHRNDRVGVLEFRAGADGHRAGLRRRTAAEPPPGAAPVEFTAMFQSTSLPGFEGLGCQGGGGELALRLGRSWQGIVSGGGCQMTGLAAANRSGDGLYLLAGPRWAPRAGERWSPYLQILAGGAKYTVEEADPLLRRRAYEIAAQTRTRPDFNSFGTLEKSGGLMLAAGGGLDMKINAALAFRVGSLEYRRGWFSPVSGYPVAEGLQFSTGLILRMGTW
jgi:hypothetical protein